MLPEGILFSTQTPPKAPTTPRGEKGVFHHPPYRSYQKSNKIRSKLKSRKAHPKNTKNLDILTILASQTLPKTRLKPSEIEPKRPLGRLLDPLEPSWQQSLEKRRQKVAQETLRTSQNPPKTLPKTPRNPSKNACEKYIVFGSVFFTIFFNFGFQNHLFFNEFLMRASIQISSIFGSLSPSQSISFGRMFDNP